MKNRHYLHYLLKIFELFPITLLWYLWEIPTRIIISGLGQSECTIQFLSADKMHGGVENIIANDLEVSRNEYLPNNHMMHFFFFFFPKHGRCKEKRKVYVTTGWFRLIGLAFHQSIVDNIPVDVFIQIVILRTKNFRRRFEFLFWEFAINFPWLLGDQFWFQLCFNSKNS